MSAKSSDRPTRPESCRCAGHLAVQLDLGVTCCVGTPPPLATLRSERRLWRGSDGDGHGGAFDVRLGDGQALRRSEPQEEARQPAATR